MPISYRLYLLAITRRYKRFLKFESNPHFAKRIADQATQLAQYLGSVEGFQRLFQEEFIEPFRRAIEAYQPVSMINPNATWEDVLKSDGKGFSLMGKALSSSVSLRALSMFKR